MRKKKLSDSVSKDLANATQQALEDLGVKIESPASTDPVEEPESSSEPLKKKRHRRTKVEMEEARKQESEAVKKKKEDSAFEFVEDPNIPIWEQRPPHNTEEFCEWEIQKAHTKGLPNPDFDFRKEYHKGQTIYLVRTFNMMGIRKELEELRLRTIYPRMLVGVKEKGTCECIDYNEQDNIFTNIVDAKLEYDSIEAEAYVETKSSKGGDIYE